MADMAEFVQGDYTFYIRPMDPFKALDLLGDLQKAFLPAIGAALGKVDLGESAGAGNITLASVLKQEIDIKGAVTQLSGAINGVNLTGLLQRILVSDYISYAKDGDDAKKFDKAAQIQVFQGNLSGMFALAWQVLRVNYADFFTTFPGLTGEAIGGEKM